MKIKELENKNIDMKNKYENNLKELSIKYENEIKILNNKIIDLENNISLFKYYFINFFIFRVAKIIT